MEGYLLLFLLSVNSVFAEEGEFFAGHYDGYSIPPPIDRNGRADTVTTAYFSQILDHYDPTNTARFQQRYFVNTQYFNETERNVAFLMLGGEAQALIQWMTGGAWIHTARMYNALLFQLEHRYYGQSHPFANLETANMRYLSSQQALEDIAEFISAMNRQYNLAPDVKWILFGGSYSASLAVWARQKYPHLVHGAMASSGPLFAKLDFYEYLEVVADSLATHSQQCVDSVKTAFLQLENFITNPGTENVTAIFNLCYDINLSENKIPNNVAYLFERLSSNIAGVIQYHGIPGQANSIHSICGIMTNQTLGREIERLAEVNRLFYGTRCLNYRFQALLTSMSNTAISLSGNSRQWYYQTCTEYGWYQTTNQKEPVFGNRTSENFFTQVCTNVYGSKFNASYTSDQNERINRHYGGYDVNASNVIHVQGTLDPWYPMGLTRTISQESPVIFINGTSHCANLYGVSSSDPSQLTAARDEINRVIGIWLGKDSGTSIHLSVALLLIALMAKIF
ncbi:hypothetical protein NQ315_000827 [Exocentrus adspersus]|uniref:Serine protease K12H4.7 n=1 Tax=Exocentrus adspersus TaxID=1586481 RepID=A0AAV8WE01_9CUCU|nr:hypothetical protein NQ315_000827 [Exocentrus adspersus]